MKPHAKFELLNILLYTFVLLSFFLGFCIFLGMDSVKPYNTIGDSLHMQSDHLKILDRRIAGLQTEIDQLKNKKNGKRWGIK